MGLSGCKWVWVNVGESVWVGVCEWGESERCFKFNSWFEQCISFKNVH